MRSLNEECGVFGVWKHPQAATVTYFGLHNLQHRGQESCGIVTFNENGMSSLKGVGLVSKVFKNEQNLQSLLGDKAIGHVRYAATDVNSMRNVQPFRFNFNDGDIALCQNGSLINANSLRQQLEQDGSVFFSTSDTEVLIHLIRKSKQLTFKEKIKESLNTIKGSFTFLIMTPDALYGAVDPNAFRPLAIGKTKTGTYMMASETCALDAVGAEFVCEVSAGELAIVTDDGLVVENYCEDTQIAVTAMEYVYFARPDSDILGVNVHTARKNTGKRLAVECPADDCDIVIGVPNSSLSAASGYAEQSGLPYEMGLIKNQYTARTFIQPTQDLREQGVRMKLIPVKKVVAGKKVVVVDDSIVRGTTSLRIIKILREAGAKEVHMRIASPPLLFPSYYGIDIQDSKDLIAANQTLEEIRRYIDADSLGFISEEGLIDAIGLNLDVQNKGICMDCFNGDYPTKLYDYEEHYLQQLTPIQKEFLAQKEKRRALGNNNDVDN